MEFNGTFFAVIITFLIFVWLMNKVLYEPVRKIVEERKLFISGNLTTAENNDKKSEELTTQRDEKLLEAKEDARLKYNELLDAFKLKKSELISNAQTEAKTELEEAYKNLENISNEAKEGLKNSMLSIANDIVEKVIGYKSDVTNFDNDAVDRILYKEEEVK